MAEFENKEQIMGLTKPAYRVWVCVLYKFIYFIHLQNHFIPCIETKFYSDCNESQQNILTSLASFN